MVGLIAVVVIVAVAISDIPQLQSSTEKHIERVTIEDIISNPEDYVNTGKNVSVEGQLAMVISLFPRQTEDGEYCEWSLVDEQKFSIILAPPLPYEDSRAYSIGETYRVKGKVIYLNIKYPNITTTPSPDEPPMKIKQVLALKPIEMTKL
jgi:hypothetical protein